MGERGVLLLYDTDGARVRVARSAEGEDIDVGTLSSTVVRAARDSGEPVLVPNVLADDQLAQADSLDSLEIRSVVCLPLKDAAGDNMGVLYVDSRRTADPARLQGDNLRYFEALADQAALAVRNAGRFSSLSSQLAAQTQELRRTAEALERSNRDLQEFAYSASHDLREPLRAIVGFCGLLQRKHAGQLGDEAARYLGFVTEGAGRMNDMIAGLLQYSRLETSGWTPEQVDAGEVFDGALLNLSAAIQEAGADVARGDLPVVAVPRGQLSSLFQNLIGNAVKFRTDATPVVRVAATVEGDLHHFTVADNGIGISNSMRPHVFQVFRRLHSRDAYDGTGIGLAVCRKVVDRAGGRIWSDARAGGGTTFHFTLPVVASDL